MDTTHLGMGTTYSKPKRPWSGFAPAGYRLNLRTIWGSQLQIVRDGAPESSTVGHIVGEIGPSVTKVDGGFGLTLETANGALTVRGGSFLLEVIKTVLQLRLDGVEPLHALWFWFDEDHLDDDLQRSFTFFVAYNNRILDNVFTFPDYDSSEFNPDVFEPLTTDWKNVHWKNARPMEESLFAYWYRRFYKDTPTGQLVVLRPDEPKLFFYPEGRAQIADEVAGIRADIRALQKVVLLVGLAVALIVVVLFLR